MGLRIDQVNINSFKKVFPLRSDISNIIVSNLKGSESIKIEKTEKDILHMSVLPSTNDTLGGVIVGENIELEEDGRISVNTADTDKLGVVRVGENIELEDGTISVPKTSVYKAGLVKIGRNIDLNDDTISLKLGSKSDFGLLKVGENIEVNDGVISISPSVIFDNATKEERGVVRIGENIDVNNGLISVKTATSTDLGVVRSGENIVNRSGQISVNNASQAIKGVVSVGENINIDGTSKISVNTGSKTSKGVLQVGENINVQNGVISTDINKSYVDNLVHNLQEKDTALEARIATLEATVAQHTKLISDLKASVAQLDEFVVYSSAAMEQLHKRIEMLESAVSEELLELRPLRNKAFYVGSVSLNGYNTTTTVRLPSGFTNANYRVCLCPNSPTNGSLGEIWVSEKTANSFTLSNTGQASMVKTDFIIMPAETHSPAFNINDFPYQKGTGQFNGKTGRQISITNMNNSTDYKVMIFPVKTSSTSTGSLGEYWVSDKTATSFKVYNSGSDTVSNFDYIVFNSGNPVYNATNNPIIEGSGTFAGANLSKEIQITETTFPKNNFSVLITPTANPGGNLGEVWVESKTTNTFTVCNTGSAKSSFDYVIIG